MPQFTMEVTLTGVILILGQALTFFAFVWKRSSVEAEQRGKIEGLITKVTALEAKSDGQFERMDTEFGAKIAALQGGINLTRDNHHELREHLATNYMKREEILQMERRVVDGQTNIMARIDKFETRLDTMQKAILDAITSERRGRQ